MRRAFPGLLSPFTADATSRSASTSRPESISSSIARSASRTCHTQSVSQQQKLTIALFWCIFPWCTYKIKTLRQQNPERQGALQAFQAFNNTNRSNKWCDKWRCVTASCKISFRFFSPPLKPSLTLRSKKLGSMLRAANFGERKP
jgi:hypothetical protein